MPSATPAVIIPSVEVCGNGAVETTTDTDNVYTITKVTGNNGFEVDMGTAASTSTTALRRWINNIF